MHLGNLDSNGQWPFEGWHTHSNKNTCLRGVGTCKDSLWHFFVQTKVPQSVRLSAVEGVQLIFGQCPVESGFITCRLHFRRL